MTIFVGIDPGLTGAIAFIGPRSVVIEDLPTIELPGKSLVRSRLDGRALAVLVRRNVPADDVAHVTCETVRVILGGKTSMTNTAQSQGSLMRTLGALEAVFDVLRMPMHMVEPRVWQRRLRLEGKNVAPRAKGQRHAGTLLAVSLYPSAAPLLALVKDHNKAEALLIAHHGKSTA